MNVLPDQSERDRFVAEQARNISVIAPAGVGKTHAIVERIVHLARQSDAAERLPRLVVVTYSVRAAREMQQRARAAIRAAGVPPRVQRAFQQTFFGTIHSFCVRLLDRFGHYLGLPASVALLEADDELWERFLLRGLNGKISDEPGLRDLFRFCSPEKLYALGKAISPGEEITLKPAPVPELEKLLDYRDGALSAPTKKSIAKAQAAAREWRDAWTQGERFQELPSCPESEKAAVFARLWTEAFAPLQMWLRESTLSFGRRVANAYETFRLSEAVMTYDDQIRLALRVLKHPAVQKELKAEAWSVLLDEAQDTDPLQFEVLLKVAGLRGEGSPANDQSFCIVGDFQQAIYAPRSDLAVYRKVHDEISAEPRGTSSRFQVTFRCDRKIIAFVNRVFPSILSGNGGQCTFIELVPRPGAGSGQVTRWLCPGEPDSEPGKKINAAIRARHEAQFLAREIARLGPAGLGADSWSQVAILCPRRQWLREIGRELQAAKLPMQLHSSDEQQGNQAPRAWLVSLLWIAAHPEDSFEITGVLREIFGVSDHDLATYTRRNGEKLRLDRSVPEGEGMVEKTLRLLRDVFAGVDGMPLHQAVNRIVTRTALRERLALIADPEVEDTDRDLDDFLALILERCAAGTTLSALAEELRRSLDQASPGEEEVIDAIQLLTSHKAKGLEWQAVIVPFIFRTIESRQLPYPRLIRDRDGGEVVCRDKNDFTAGLKDFIDERERQQFQRLLYVMCTRARHTLVLVDDEALFAGAIRRPGWPLADLAGFSAEANRNTWEELPENLSPVIEPVSVATTLRERVPSSLTVLANEDFTRARELASAIPRRITPHALAEHPVVEAEPEKLAEQEEGIVAAVSSGILYGTWWHEFVEGIPWREPVDVWRSKLLEALPRSPQPERSQEEAELFFQSSLAHWLSEPGRVVQTEFPFLWLEAGNTCVEGVIDLAVYTPGDSSWRVIDWKTNRLGPEGANGLVEIYREQIRAYVKVLRGMLSAEVRGSLYLTVTGEWVDID